jgi:hypothetical protein
VLIKAQIAAPLVGEFVQKSAGLFQKTAIDTCAVKPMLVAAAAEGRGKVDGKSEKYRLGYLRSRVCDLAFWLFEHRPRRSI